MIFNTEIIEMKSFIDQKKWCFATFCSDSLDNVFQKAKWHRFLPRRWVHARHLIESFGLAELEKKDDGLLKLRLDGMPHYNDYIAAYKGFVCSTFEDFKKQNKIIFQNEIKSADFLQKNMFIYLVRRPMPLGGKPFVPLDEKANWLLTRAAAEESPENELIVKKMQKIAEYAEMKFHASDRKTFKVQVDTPITILFQGQPTVLQTSTTVEYLVPEENYMCSQCNEFGLHYREACHLWPKKLSAEKSYGSKKLGPSKALDLEDSKKLSLMHERKRQT
jgi:hypothetical protein